MLRAAGVGPLSGPPRGARRRVGDPPRYGGTVLRRVVGGIGRLLIALGVLILLFVVYQLWGTNLSEAASQNTLKQQFDRSLHHGTSPTTSTTIVPESTTTTAAVPPVEGNPIGVIRIPKIGVDKYIVEGTGEDDLKKGPGHYPGTPLPGQLGNVAIAGHRTTYGAPFYNLNELAPGDPIMITTAQGQFEYDVIGTQVVSPSDVQVVAPTPDGRLTLTTCNPRFSAKERMVVQASLKNPPPAPPPATTPTTLPKSAKLADGLTTGSSSAIPDTVMWGLAALAFVAVVWLVARRWRRWPTYLAAVIPFLVLLYFFFLNVSQLLPSSI